MPSISGSRPSRGNVPLAVRHLIEQYRRFLRTSYRFLDERLRQQFEEHLAAVDIVVKGPFVTLAREFELGRTLAQTIADGDIDPQTRELEWAFGRNPLYRHQERALRLGRQRHSFVVTTGTGSGKTESFLLPVIDGILRRKRDGVRGVQAVFLYPMNALANDQLERLRRLVRGSGVDLSFALYTGDSDTTSRRLREDPAETERLEREAIRRDPPDLLLTNYKQLEFLLVRAADRHLFGPALRYLVLDEVHSYRGALATEIACLIRRLKARAGLRSGELVTIGTSATVAAAEEGAAALADFASALFGETVGEDSIVAEARLPSPVVTSPAPPNPQLADVELENLDPSDDGAVVALAERLTGGRAVREGSLARRVGALLRDNGVIECLQGVFAEPRSLADAVDILRKTFGDRAAADPESVRREVEAYLLVGSIGDEDDPPFLRPKLHTFFHGVYNVALCLGCRSLVPQGSSECPSCRSVARPAALCRTCGQDFVKVVLPADPSSPTEGTGDYFSNEHTAFLAPRLHELPSAEADDDVEEIEEEPPKDLRRRGSRKRPEEARICAGCGRLYAGDRTVTECPVCRQPTQPTLVFRGKLSKCPTCGDIYTRGDIVTPLRTGTASTVSVLATHHLDDLDQEDRKLLVFADNRQDAAHQAGYSADRHRSIALRHSVLAEVRSAESEGVAPLPLTDLPQRLFDRFRDLELIPRKKQTEAERRRWLDALTLLAATEVTRSMRQRTSLEALGLIEVSYEFLGHLLKDPRFLTLSRRYDLGGDFASGFVSALLDVFRRNRAVAFDFFQEYTDPNRNRRYRELEAEPFNLRFADHDQQPRAFAFGRSPALRRGGVVQGIVQENEKAGQLVALQKLAFKLVGDRHRAGQLLRDLVPLLVEHEILVRVMKFPIPKKEWPASLDLLQLAPRVIGLGSTTKGFRCNACRTWRAYWLPFCANPRCKEGVPQPAVVDDDNYYVRLYRDRAPQRFLVQEHSAQIGGEERADRERRFKEGRIEALVCTPTLELGVDIGPLLTVVLRNAPPTPANYAQRVGRAGRRLQIGFASTFCTGGAHDRHSFVEPSWLIAGEFSPPRIRLDNPRVVERHLRSLVLENVESSLPARLGELLDNKEAPTAWRRADLEPLFREVAAKEDELVGRIEALFADDRAQGRAAGPDAADCRRLVGSFESDIAGAFEAWWQRVRQLDREFHEYSKIGSPRQDERKARARKRAFYEITADPQRAYTLNYLAERGKLPAYQFPLDTFSLDPGVDDTPTLHRPAAIAIEEFAPGNYVYANGHKLRSIRVLFPGGPGAQGVGRSDAESSGRLEEFHFCDHCDEAVEAPQNSCPRCRRPLPSPTPLLFVEDFEAEENLKIGADEESRQRERQLKRETLLAPADVEASLYSYPLAPVLHVRLAEMLVSNWGKTDRKRDDAHRFWLCPDCGRHCPYDPPMGEKPDPAVEKKRRSWLENHARFCSGELTRLVLGYRFRTDALVIAVPSDRDPEAVSRNVGSTLATTLAEALRLGAGEVLELEADEIATFVRRPIDATAGEEIVYYETTPGGSGYTEEMARRLPEVAVSARRLLYEHHCARACYLCLKHFRNQRVHALLDKDAIRGALLALAALEPVPAQVAGRSELQQRLSEMMEDRVAEARRDGAPDDLGRYRKGFIEEPLLASLRRCGDIAEPMRDNEIKDEFGRIVTVPDFAWPDVRLAVYCDGYAFHGDPNTLELDARKRNWLQQRGWVVLVYWGRTILRDPDECAKDIASAYRSRVGIV